MLNFTVGPVMSCPEVLDVNNVSAPYFRTSEFSNIMLENEELMLKFMYAPKGSRCVFLTSSGTGAMESAVISILNHDDKVLVVNGGSFGQRFVELCKLHKLFYTEISIKFGKQIKFDDLDQYKNKGYTSLLINMNETSSGTLYDMELVSRFCKQQGILLIVDAISSFIADKLNMDELGAAAVLTGSQKALAVYPGVSVMVLAPEALERIEKNPEICMYLSLKEALKNGIRGQTPYTPAVMTLLQIHKRLCMIDEKGGVERERAHIIQICQDFRQKIANFPFSFVSESMSNAVTALHPLHSNANDIVQIMKDKYNIWICPNGGDKANEVFRVGHIGYIKMEDNKKLINSFKKIMKYKII